MEIDRERFYEYFMDSERETILIDLYSVINIICIYYYDYILYQYSNDGKPQINSLFDLPNTMYIVKSVEFQTRKLWIFTWFFFVFTELKKIVFGIKLLFYILLDYIFVTSIIYHCNYKLHSFHVCHSKENKLILQLTVLYIYNYSQR